jgi:hypothetical protein
MSNDMTGFTPSQFRDFLLGWFKSGNYTDVVYAEGHHGIGKTDIILQVAIDFFGTEEQKKMDPLKVLAMSDAERGWVFVREYPATKNVEDYTGIPFRDPATDKTKWATPEFFPTVGKGVMVIEELNQATEEVLKAMFPMLQDKRIGSHVLSPEVFLVITGNPPNSIHHVVDFPIALKDRMQRVGFVHFAKDWVKWAKSVGTIHPCVIDFVEQNPTLMHVIPDDGSLGPTPRAWTCVSRVAYAFEKGLIKEFMFMEALKNRVGDKAAVKFFGHLKNTFKRAVTVDELFEDYDKFLPRFKEQPAAGKAESVDSVMQWVEQHVADLTKDSGQLMIVKDLFVNHTSNGILVAKAMAISPETINKLVQLGPNGVTIGQKLASIRHTAEQDNGAK